jgi:hypothetical protein
VQSAGDATFTGGNQTPGVREGSVEVYTPLKADYLADEYKCHRFYSTRPNPAYYVVDIDHILGPAALFR